MSDQISNTGILLESGTKEIEIMEFTIDGNLYGINVAKVREIIMSDKVNPMPHTHPAVEGVFKPRDTLLTVIDLPMYLTGVPSDKKDRDLFIITNFNNLFMAFRVHTVEGIYRISWQSIQKPDKIITGGDDGVATGIAQCGKDFVTILDFEKIVAEISPETSIKLEEIEKMGHRERNNSHIVIAEDSILLSKMLTLALSKAGYNNVTKFNNGQETWDYFNTLKNEEGADKKVDLVITDIEMPMMDGHRLTKLIKSDDELKDIPVVIFSSLINEEMQIKGKEVGADEQLSKPEIGHLVEVIDHLLSNGK